MATTNIIGTSAGRLNIVVNDQLLPTLIESFGNAIEFVQTVSDSRTNLIEFRPGRSHNPFTTFEPGSSYIVNALSSFSFEDASLSGSWVDSFAWNDKLYWKETSTP